MKTGTKRVLLIIQSLALTALTFATILMLMDHKGYDLYLFERAVSGTGVPCLFSVFFLSEIVFLAVFYAAKKKLVLILPILLLIPLLLGALVLWSIRCAIRTDSYVLSYEGIESDIFVESESFFFGFSALYEKDGILLKKLIAVEGNNGHCPLSSRSNITIEVDGNTVRFYNFMSVENHTEICLHDERGHFTVESK